MKTQKNRESFNVSYTSRDAHTGDDIKNINMSWENQPVAEVIQNLNVWLTSVGLNLEIVEKDKTKK